jgi:glyoxylase-like metal-dependent hydrolase (beta-lactamase superfamily II)
VVAARPGARHDSRRVTTRRWLLCSLLVLACNRSIAPTAPAAAMPASNEAAAPRQAPQLEDPDPTLLRLVEVAPGIHAALQPEARRFNDCNAALVVTEAGVAIIDPPQRVAAMQWLHARADAMGRAPRRLIVTTHWHLDHSLGGSLLRAALADEGAPFEHWGHAGLPPLLATEGLAQLQERRAWYPGAIERGTAMKTSGQRADGTPLQPEELVQLDADLLEIRAEADVVANAELRPPTHPVAEPTSVALGSLTLALIPVRAHTEADLVVHIPEAGVLVTGDVLDEIPYCGHGRPRRWLAALQRLRDLEPIAIIPGHGPVLGPEHLERMIELWEALLEQALLAIQRGETPEQRYAEWQTTPAHQALRTALVTDPSSDRAFASFIPGALARAMADLRGDLDAPPVTH